MQWMFWQKPVARELSDQVKKHLIAEFDVDQAMVDKMRFWGKKGRYSDRPVKYLRIYDPILIKESGSGPLSYDALAQKSENGGALLFEGRIEANQQFYITDYRTPAA